MGQTASRPTVSLDEQTDEWVRQESEARGVSISTVVQDAIRAAAGLGGPYGDGVDAGAGDTGVGLASLSARVDDHDDRLRRLESAVGGVDVGGASAAAENGSGDAHAGGDGGDAGPGAPTVTDAQLREAVEHADWSEIMYAETSGRVDGVVAAVAALRDGNATRTPDLAEIVDAHADVGEPARLLSDVCGRLDTVETPTPGSDRYEWVGDAGVDAGSDGGGAA